MAETRGRPFGNCRRAADIAQSEERRPRKAEVGRSIRPVGPPGTVHVDRGLRFEHRSTTPSRWRDTSDWPSATGTCHRFSGVVPSHTRHKGWSARRSVPSFSPAGSSPAPLRRFPDHLPHSISPATDESERCFARTTEVQFLAVDRPVHRKRPGQREWSRHRIRSDGFPVATTLDGGRRAGAFHRSWSGKSGFETRRGAPRSVMAARRTAAPAVFRPPLSP